MNLNLVYLITLFVFGAAMGSFISVLVYRLHHRESGIVGGRSKCVECKTPLKAKDLVPLLSYLFLRGKCRYCNKEISYMYPALELVSGLVYTALFFKFPFIDQSLTFDGLLLLQYVLFGIYTFVLLFTFFFDLHYHQVADEILLPAILLGLVATLVPGAPHIIDALIGILIPVGFFGAQFVLSRGAWIGAGDLRVGAFMGVILGWQLVVVALVISYALGSLVSLVIALQKKRFYGVRIPFAPFLVTGTLITVFFGQQILSYYLSSLGV